MAPQSGEPQHLIPKLRDWLRAGTFLSENADEENEDHPSESPDGSS
jgi:hypothetical protein